MNDLIDEMCPRCHGFVWHRRDPCKCQPVKVDVFNHTQQLLDTIGKRLKACRESKNLSLDQLADRASISKTGLWEIESGRSEPRAFTLIALAQALEVRIDYLLCQE